MPNIKEYIEELKSEFSLIAGSYLKINGKNSGEYFTQEEYRQYIKIKMEELDKQQHKEIGQYAIENDIELDYKLKKVKTPRVKEFKIGHYENGNFSMMYRDGRDELMSIKLDVNEKVVYYVLRDFIEPYSNCIVINGKIPTFEELESIVGFKERTIRKAIKSLEEKGLVKLAQSGHKKAIYINPQYFASCKDFDKDTLKLFGLLDCDEEKVRESIDI